MLSIVGDDSAAESDASSVSDYDATSDPMDRFSVTALPATALPGTALLAPHPQASQPGPSSAWHQSQQQVPMQLPYASDDSAHDPRNLGGRLTSGVGEEEAEGSAVRPDLAALRGRDDSARDMPVLLYICTILYAHSRCNGGLRCGRSPNVFQCTVMYVTSVVHVVSQQHQ